MAVSGSRPSGVRGGAAAVAIAFSWSALTPSEAQCAKSAGSSPVRAVSQSQRSALSFGRRPSHVLWRALIALAAGVSFSPAAAPERWHCAPRPPSPSVGGIAGGDVEAEFVQHRSEGDRRRDRELVAQRQRPLRREFGQQAVGDRVRRRDPGLVERVDVFAGDGALGITDQRRDLTSVKPRRRHFELSSSAYFLAPRATERVDDLNALEVLFVVGHDDALVGFGYCGNDCV